MHRYGTKELVWVGETLRLGAQGRKLVEVVPDAKWPGMWRVRSLDGSLSDMVNLTRAKDAALSAALRVLGQPA